MLRRARSYVVLTILAIPVLLAAVASEEGMAQGVGAPSAAPSLTAAAPVRDVEDSAIAHIAALPARSAVPAVVPTEVPTLAPETPAPRTPVPVVAAAAATPAPTAQPAGCPSGWFCYPRLGVAGAIVPYTDCSGGSDVGTSIRAFTCLSPNYLMGHAYTQMGKITGWAAGDTVYAYGRAFTVYNALVEQSCQPPVFPLAPLSMQTSLSPNTCGPVLVVQAH